MTASAIEYHHQHLKQLLAMLLVYAGLTDENEQVRSPAGMRQRASEPFTLSRRIRDMVLRLLVPVESATRRLIVVLAGQLPVEERPALAKHTPTPNPSPQGGGEPDTATLTDSETAELGEGDPEATNGGIGTSGAAVSSLPPPKGARFGEGLGVGGRDQTALPRLPLFALADTPKRYDWFYNPLPEGEAPWAGPGHDRADPFERLDALPLMRRVAALALALNDLPRQAKRFLRWRAMRLKARAAGKHLSDTPLRTGEAPGAFPYRAPQRLWREEHGTLKYLDLLAREALRRLDSS